MSVTQFSCSLKLTGAQTLSQHVSACQCWAIFSLYYKNCIERVNIYVTFWHWNHSIKQCCVLRHFWHESVNAKVVTISICQITVSLSSTMAAHVTWSFPPRQRHCLVVLLKILWTGTEFPVSRRKPLFPLYIYQLYLSVPIRRQYSSTNGTRCLLHELSSGIGIFSGQLLASWAYFWLLYGGTL